MYTWAFEGTDGGEFTLSSINVTATHTSYALSGHLKRGKSAPTQLNLMFTAEKGPNDTKMKSFKISGDTDKFLGHFEAGAGPRPVKS